MLRELGSHLWCVERSARHLGLTTVERTTILRLGSEDLLLHAPDRPSPALLAALGAIGRVRYLLAPNAWTEIDWVAWQRACSGRTESDLTLLAPAAWAPGASRKAEPLDGAVARVTLAPTGTGVAAIDEALDFLPVAGMPRLDEWLLLHRASRSLLVGDLVRGVESEGPIATRLLRASALGRGPLGTPRDVRWLVRDRDALRASVEAALRWPFDRVVPRRGPVAEGDGRAALGRALGWVARVQGFWQ